MLVFNQRPPVGHCDPNSELLKYYEDSNKQIKDANRLYEYQNSILRMKLATLETAKFYNGNQDLLVVRKENAKLKKSLRKLYEKYIKPYKNHRGDVLMTQTPHPKGYQAVYMPPEVAEEVNAYLSQFTNV